MSEFFSCNGLAAFNRRCRSGQWIWRLGSQQQARARLMLQGDFEEMLYPVNAPNARFTRAPTVMCAALPHLTPEPEARYRELTPHARQWPPVPPPAHTACKPPISPPSGI